MKIPLSDKMLAKLFVNSKLTRTGKVYLSKRVDHNLKLPTKAIPNYILKLYEEYLLNPMLFKTSRTKSYFRKYKLLLERYNLIENTSRNRIKARDNWNQYMRDYRQKQKELNSARLRVSRRI